MPRLAVNGNFNHLVLQNTVYQCGHKFTIPTLIISVNSEFVPVKREFIDVDH
jgi:hypothetical protein